jgi:hypothetical protein
MRMHNVIFMLEGIVYYNTKAMYVRAPVKTRVSANTYSAGVQLRRRLVGEDAAKAVADKALTATAAASGMGRTISSLLLLLASTALGRHSKSSGVTMLALVSLRK